MTTADSEHKKFKDDQPVCTVNRIRRILHELDILTTEQWSQAGDSMHSVRVEIVGTDVGQNGKGTTPEYALASAYGEFIERLQLGTLYQGAEPGDEALTAEGFYHAPDEEYLTLEQLLETGGPVLNHLLKPGAAVKRSAAGTESLWADKFAQWFGEDDQATRRALLKEWGAETPTGAPSDFICLPYFSLKDERLYGIPFQMLRLPYLHNGAAAGNTPEEALVQAMSEILERYVHRQIMAGTVTPPDIPLDSLGTDSRLACMVKQVQEHGFHLMIKDCSLNLGIPVVGVVIVDQKVRSYFVKFGVHPSFEVALERCLTEVAQGRDLFGADRGWMTRFQYQDEALHTPQNANNVLRTGTGSYPRNFLAANPLPFPGFPPVDQLSNKDLLTQLTAILLELGTDVLVRDVSYLGFSTFQVIVPGVSEVFEFDGARLRRERFRREVRQIARNLPSASTEQLHKVVSYLVKRSGFVFEAETLSQLPGIPARFNFPWNETPKYEFIGAALYKMGKVGEAAGFIRQLAHSPGVKRRAGHELYYSAVSDYLVAREKGEDESEVISLLTLFYGAELVKTVMEQWGNPAAALDRFAPLPCWNCAACALRDCCSSEKLREIHRKFKKRQADNPLDQMKLRQMVYNKKKTNRVT